MHPLDIDEVVNLSRKKEGYHPLVNPEGLFQKKKRKLACAPRKPKSNQREINRIFMKVVLDKRGEVGLRHW
jgi:hypothetical protein